MPVSRFTGSYSISSAITKLVNCAGRHGSGFDLQARVGQQADDGDRAEKFDQRRGDRLLRDIAQIAAPQPLRAVAKAVRLDFLRAERLHHLVAR